MISRTILFLIAASTVFGQTSPPPQFEVASVKPNTGLGRAVSIGSPSPGRFHAENVWLRFLVQTAWNVKDFQVVGGPGWAASDRYDIDAITDGKASFEQMRPMLRTLLEDRFRLVLHRESKEFPVYELTAVPKGIKVQVSKEGSCVPRSSGPSPPGPPPIYCGATSWGPRNIDGNSISMQEFTTMLANILQRQVIDKTGFTGSFDVHIEWTPDQRTPGLMAPNVALPPVPAADDPGSTIFTVLEEQLGLKLQASKAPGDVLVIDRAEKPAAN